ncbi:MAG: hypothetical protein DI566_09405 [Microbacterium sp.]|nr:MAG: hypothetical protein DI566_09405 [Microbacterium sp.]
MSSDSVSFVTVTYRAEDSLLRLQARSFALFVPVEAVAEIVVIDNGRPLLSERRRAELLRAYGPHADRVRFVPSDELAATGAMSGWVGQQVLKLSIAAYVRADWYVLLDAKNHAVRPLRPDDLLNGDGRARGGFHSYAAHPLRDRLLTTLDYLGLDRAAADHYPPTSTPFVLQTQAAREVLAGFGDDFAGSFHRAGLSEFFLYSGWILRRDGDWDAVYDGVALQSPTLWGGTTSAAAIGSVLAEVERTDAPFFGVHRRALRRMTGADLAPLAHFWIARGLFSSVREVRRFRARFLREHAISAARSRLSRR